MSTLEMSDKIKLMKRVNFICTILLVFSTMIFSISFAAAVYFIVTDYTEFKQDVEMMQTEYIERTIDHNENIEKLKNVVILFQNKKTVYDVRVSRLQDIELKLKELKGVK